MSHERGWLAEELRRRGLSRRDFMSFCATMAASLALPDRAAAQIARAIQKTEKPVLVWLEFQDCAGNTEGFLRGSRPTAAEVILDVLSLDYHETLMAAAGHQAEANLAKTVKERAGAYIAIVEGSIPTGANGAYCTIGGRAAIDIAREVCASAAATIAIGTCASFGGIPAAAPNPTGALSVADAVPGVKNLINLSACPANVENLHGAARPLPDVQALAAARSLSPAAVRVRQDDPRQLRAARALQRRPVRRGVGRRGPSRWATASTRWAARARSPRRTVRTSAGTTGTNWPIGCGHPCIGCAEPNFWDTMTPFYQHLSGIPGFGAASDIDTIGAMAVLGVGAAFAGHGLIQIMKRVWQPARTGAAEAASQRRAVMSRVVVDPVTRIEGHLRIEAEVDGGAVRDAWSSSTMFRGIEIILKGRDPRDAWAFAQRICGVCTTVHAIASIRAVENAIGAAPPPNARLLRNLIMAAQCVQDHVVHFYHLHALDWVDIVSALSADPAKTSSLAESISDWPLSSPKYFAGVRDRLKGFVDRGQLGPFANAYWGHPAYRLPPEANLMAVAHYLEALDWQREFIKMHAVLGGKNPHLQSFLVGGMATPVDPDSQAALNTHTIAQLKSLRRDGARLRGPRLHPGPAGHRVVLQGLGRARPRRRQLPGLRRISRGRHARQPPLFIPPGIIRGAGSVEGGAVRSRQHHRVRHAFLVPLRAGRRDGAASVQGRDVAQLHRPDAAVRAAQHRQQVFVAEVAALRRRADGGRTARAHARRVRVRPRARQGARRRHPEEALRRPGGAVLDARPRRGARHRDAGARREDGRLGRRPRGEHGGRRAAHPRQLEMGAAHAGRPTRRAAASTKRRAERSATG